MARNTARTAICSTAQGAPSRLNRQTVRYRITATDRKFAQLLKLLENLRFGHSPNIQTRSTITLVVNSEFASVFPKLECYGTFLDDIDATALASVE